MRPQAEVGCHAVGQRLLRPAWVVPALAVAAPARQASEASVCMVCRADGARVIQRLRIDQTPGTLRLEDLSAARVA